MMTAISSKGGIRNKKAIAYLEKCVYPDLKIALAEVSDNNIHSMIQFIATVHENGELEKHWTQIEKHSSQARRAAIKLEKMQRKLEMGSDYDGSDNDQEDKGNGGVESGKLVQDGEEEEGK